MIRKITLSTCCLALALTPVFTRGDAAEKAKMMMSAKDSKEFAMKAASSGMLEVKLAQLAQQKAQSPEVKQLAQKLEQDHAQANQQLMQVAKQKNITLPSDLKGEGQETYQAFQQLEGKDFDNAYLLANIKNHLHCVMMFQKEAQNGTDQDVKQWAMQTLPKLQQHTRHIGTVAMACDLPVDAIAGTGQAGGDAARPAGAKIQGSGAEHRDHPDRK